MKSDHTPSQSTIAPGQVIEMSTRFGGCSRGRSWGKCYPGQSRPTGPWRWVEKIRGSVLMLDEPGYYIVGSSDGFSRNAKSEFCLRTAPADVEAATPAPPSQEAA